MLCRAHGVANALRPAPRLTARDALSRADAASMWLRASRGDAGMSSKADMASLASNIVGPLPAYPDSVGDWVEPVEEATAWLKAEAPEESWRSQRRRRRDKERRAAALSAGAYQASIGDWIADDHVDDEPTPPANPGDAQRLAAPREKTTPSATNARRTKTSAATPPWRSLVWCDAAPSATRRAPEIGGLRRLKTPRTRAPRRRR